MRSLVLSFRQLLRAGTMALCLCAAATAFLGCQHPGFERQARRTREAPAKRPKPSPTRSADRVAHRTEKCLLAATPARRAEATHAETASQPRQPKAEAQHRDKDRRRDKDEAEEKREGRRPGIEEEEEEGEKPDHPGEAVAFRLEQMADERGEIPDGALVRALDQRRAMRVDPASWAFTRRPPKLGRNGKAEEDLTAGIEPGSWTAIGPGNIGGRVRAIVIHPTAPTTMWAGSVGGGIWKTTNGGATWAPLNDFLASLAACALVLDPANPDVIYAGTGEGFYNGDGLRGAGIFKSADGGTNWTQLASTANPNFQYVNRLAISPVNSQIILAATRSGIWRSANGGGTWSRQLTDDTKDIDFHPTDGNKAIASGSGGLIRYSNNGGVTWSAATGISGDRIEVAYARSNPTIVYASAQNNRGELYRSTNGGVSYTLQNTGTDYLGEQGWYDNALWVDPTNPDRVIVGGIDLFRSTNAGVNLTKISQWYSAPASAHADQHVIVPHPGFNGTTNQTVFFGNDGGVYRAANISTVALTSGWQELNNNFAVTQFYGGAGNPTSGVMIGGTQDNGTLRYTTGGGAENWTTMFGGDGGWCAADPTNPNYFYGEYVYLQIHRSTNGGASSDYIYGGITDAENKNANFIAPFILDPNNANTMLGGGQSLWRSTTVRAATPTWAAIKPGIGTPISAIAVAKGNSNVIWVGYNNGDVYYTTNGTATVPAWTRADLGSPNLPNRYCHRIVIDPRDTTRIYASFGGFNSDNLFRTLNNGVTWTDVSGALPSAPVRTLQVAPFDSNFLYAGTEVGVFASANGGATWSPSNEGPANVSVDELFWVKDRLIAATHGRGFFSIIVSAALVPEIAVEQPSGTGLTDGVGNRDFGTVTVGSSSVLTFTVRNTGTGDLTGFSLSADGANAADFTVGGLAATTVAPNASTTFSVTFAPSAPGVRNAAIHLASNDADENPFDIALTGTGAPPPMPEIVLEQPEGMGLTDGVDSRDFGEVVIGNSSALTFTVRNIGDGDLTGLSIGKDGANPDEYTVGALGATTLAPNATTTVTITFAPGASGSRTAAIHLASNDGDENPFDVALTGAGTPPPMPEIVLEQPAGTELSDGFDGRDFGSVAVGSSSALTFTVRNTGTAELSGLSVAVDGPNAGEFAAGAPGATTLLPNEATSFTVTFAPGALGSRAAALHVTSNDADENPFDVALAGAGNVGAGLVLAGSIVHDGDPTGGAGNADGELNPGEEIDLDVLLRNDGGVTATSVTARLSTTSPFVTIDDPDKTWSDIPPGATVQSGGDFDFTVLSSAPIGHVIDFTLAITTNEASYTRTFSMTVLETPVPALLPDLLVGGSGSQMFGNGIYNLDATDQTFFGRMARRRSKAFFVKLENDGAETQSLTMRCEGKKRWFHLKVYLGALDISDQLTSPSGYTFADLAPGDYRFLKVKIHSRGGPRRARIEYIFDVLSPSDGLARDVVVLAVRQH